MADFVVEIKNHVQMVMDKFKHKKQSLAAALRAEVNYQVAVKTNKVSNDLEQLRQEIAIDMKKWYAQRSDLQCDINRLQIQIEEMQNTEIVQPDPLDIQ